MERVGGKDGGERLFSNKILKGVDDNLQCIAGPGLPFEVSGQMFSWFEGNNVQTTT